MAFFTEYYLENLATKAIVMCRNPVIKIYEGGAFLLTLLFRLFIEKFNLKFLSLDNL